MKKIATKITLADIAREARVGVATVDRVLNKRAAVKESTARRVLEAARQLGFTLEQPHYRLAAGKAPVTIRMGFILLQELSLIHISEPTRLGMISYAVFCLKKKKKKKN